MADDDPRDLITHSWHCKWPTHLPTRVRLVAEETGGGPCADCLAFPGQLYEIYEDYTSKDHEAWIHRQGVPYAPFFQFFRETQLTFPEIQYHIRFGHPAFGYQIPDTHGYGTMDEQCNWEWTLACDSIYLHGPFTGQFAIGIRAWAVPPGRDFPFDGWEDRYL